MINDDDLRLIDNLDNDYKAFETHADSETKVMFTERRKVLWALRSALKVRRLDSGVLAASEALVQDVRVMIECAPDRNSENLFRRREFALEKMIERIREEVG